MKAIVNVLTIALALSAAAAAPKRARFDANLPMLGTKLRALPAGKEKAAADAACLPCHSADIVVQQRLTEKQWTATVEKMIRWGAVVKDEDKQALIRYLARHFGPDNRFTPTKTRPVGR